MQAHRQALHMCCSVEQRAAVLCVPLLAFHAAFTTLDLLLELCCCQRLRLWLRLWLRLGWLWSGLFCAVFSVVYSAHYVCVV